MKRFFVCLFLCIMCLVSTVHATHIVGGEITYKCLGGYNYEISITIYEDCLTGLPDAIAEDAPAYLGIFDGTRSIFPYPYYDSIPQRAYWAKVPANFTNECINNPPPTCLYKSTFTKNYYLPPNANGYTIVYQRCCRNATVLNIVNPANIGATYSATIPPANDAICNTSAVFKNFPPQIICINNPLYYDHSATDADGDSLSYEFCQDYTGGSNNDAKPIPSPPPFDPVRYVSPFSYINPMAGYPQIQINPKTGIITGTPNIAGRFSVTVCCHEWRHGVLINTVSREFQFVVTDCSKAVVADIPQFSTDYNTYEIDCSGYTVHFVNHSKGGFEYYWNFGDTTNAGDTSNAFEPSYTYPDTGVYPVKLVVNRSSTCSDSITRLVKLYPYFATAFSYSGLQCPQSAINFTDQTNGTYKPIENWEWNFGDGNTSTDENPTHTYAMGGTYNVQLTAQNIKGCRDTTLKKITIENFHPSAGNDTIIVKGQSIYFNATGGEFYTWTPSTYLSDVLAGNPIGTFTDTGHFLYTVHVVSAFGCTGDTSIKVWVVGQGALFVPSAFTPNGDGKNDVLIPILIGYSKINSFRIYNRWGEQVYHTDQMNKGWDGRYNGRPADVGVYYWLLEVTDDTGRHIKQKGDVTLIR